MKKPAATSIKKVNPELSFVSHEETPRGRWLTSYNYFDVEPLDYYAGKIRGIQIVKQLCDYVKTHGCNGAHLEAMVVDALGLRAPGRGGGMPLMRVGKKTKDNVLSGVLEQFEEALKFLAKNARYAEYFDRQIAKLQDEEKAIAEHYAKRQLAINARVKATKAAKRATQTAAPASTKPRSRAGEAVAA